MKFWQIKYAEKPSDNDKDGYDESREKYDQGDNFNCKGIMIYFAMKMRQPYTKLPGIAADKE